MAAGKTRASSLIGIRSLHICVNVRFGWRFQTIWHELLDGFGLIAGY